MDYISKYIKSAGHFTRGEKDKEETNTYIKPMLKKNQTIEIGMFEQINNTRKHGLKIIKIKVKDIYQHHVIFENGSDTLSLTWFDIWQGMKFATSKDELEGLSLQQIELPWLR